MARKPTPRRYNAEYARLERELTTLATVTSELEKERQQAVIREVLAATRADFEEVAQLTTDILALNPRIRELMTELDGLIQESNQKRNRHQSVRHFEALRLQERLQAAGLDPQIVAPQLIDDMNALKAEFADPLKHSFAETVQQALAISSAMPRMAHPNSGLIKSKE